MFWSKSGEKYAEIKHCLKAKTALIKNCGWILSHFFVGGNRIHTFLVKNVLMLDLFELLSSPDVNWWTGVVWIIVMFFIRLSFWRHPFTAEHPLLRHFSKSDEETNSSTSWMDWWWGHFQPIFIFVWTVLWRFWHQHFHFHCRGGDDN